MYEEFTIMIIKFHAKNNIRNEGLCNITADMAVVLHKVDLSSNPISPDGPHSNEKEK